MEVHTNIEKTQDAKRKYRVIVGASSHAEQAARLFYQVHGDLVLVRPFFFTIGG